MSEPPRRERLRHINSITDAVRLLRSCKKILVLTGAGVIKIRLNFHILNYNLIIFLLYLIRFPYLAVFRILGVEMVSMLDWL